MIKNKLENFKSNIKNLDLNKIYSLLWVDNVKELFTLKFFLDRKNVLIFYIILIWTIFVTIFLLFYLIKLFENSSDLSAKTKKLKNLSLYNNQEIIGQFWYNSSIDVLLEEYKNSTQEKDNLSNYIKSIQTPYNVFLRNRLLPSLNIWKDKYNWRIDTDLVWQDYLKNNPFIDTNLLQSWGNFFKEIWVNIDSNTIKRILIWEITSEWNWIFSIPIDVKFISPNRKSFLMLINKISITSNRENIILINELIYKLWQIIKTDAWPMLKLNKIEDISNEINNKLKLVKVNDDVLNQKLDEKISCLKQVSKNIDNVKKILLKWNSIDNKYLNITISDICWESKIWWSDKIELDEDKKNQIVNNFLNIVQSFLNEIISSENDLLKDNISIKTDLQYLNNDFNTLNNIDILIWNSLNQWISNDEDSQIIDENIINKTIFWLVSTEDCNNLEENDIEKQKLCLFEFRKKYISIPSLAYTLWAENNSKRKDSLKTFFKTLPPVLNIEDFTFEEWSKEIIWWYEWNLSIKFYWQDISSQDLLEIGNTLWSKCFISSTWTNLNTLNIENAVAKLDEKINEMIKNKNADSKYFNEYWQIKDLLSDIWTKYWELNNYNKIIKLFEVYRILNENDICN